MLETTLISRERVNGYGGIKTVRMTTGDSGYAVNEIEAEGLGRAVGWQKDGQSGDCRRACVKVWLRQGSKKNICNLA